MKNANGMLLWGAGLVGVSLLALGGTDRGRKAMSEVEQSVEDWMNRVIGRVSAHEGTYHSLNLNTDGAGLSFGKLQWAQRVGGLGNLLAEMHLTDPGRFAAVFGPSSQVLLAVTAKPSLEPIDGAVLWHEPWVSRFRAAGRDPVFQAVQDRLAYGGQYMRGAIEAAKTLGVTTERSLSLTYDTTVQQGAGFAQQLAGRVRKLYAGKSVPARDVLQSYAELAPAHFRSTTEPAAPYPARNIEWRKTGNEWHAWARQIDLYTNILTRRTGLVRDPRISDELIRLPGQATV